MILVLDFFKTRSWFLLVFAYAFKIEKNFTFSIVMLRNRFRPFVDIYFLSNLFLHLKDFHCKSAERMVVDFWRWLCCLLF